jgi:hypothetical protein
MVVPTGIEPVIDEQKTAAGVNALFENDDGRGNTAFANVALANNKTGDANTAVGASGLEFHATDDNTASGFEALPVQ